MTRYRKTRGRGGIDPNQNLIAWPAGSDAPAVPPSLSEPRAEPGSSSDPSSPPATARRESDLVQVLPWDFRTSFPEPLSEAVEAGALDETDLQPENLRSLHEDYAQTGLAALDELSRVQDALRRFTYPQGDDALIPLHKRSKLCDDLTAEAGRLEVWWRTLMETYSSAFGTDAGEAFAKAIGGWYVGVKVVTSAPAATAVLSPVTDNAVDAASNQAGGAVALFPA